MVDPSLFDESSLNVALQMSPNNLENLKQQSLHMKLHLERFIIFKKNEEKYEKLLK